LDRKAFAESRVLHINYLNIVSSNLFHWQNMLACFADTNSEEFKIPTMGANEEKA
jgi:hypothetical protein